MRNSLFVTRVPPCFRFSESSDEGTQADGVVSGQTCLHVNKSVNLNASKKALRQIGVSGDCTTCLNIARKTTNPRRKGKSGDDDGGGEDDIVNGDDDRGDDEDVDDNTVDGDTLDDALDGESSSGPLDVAQQNGNASPTTTTTTTTKDCAIWLCLQCGHQGCGDINNGHVLDHYKVRKLPRYQITNWSFIRTCNLYKKSLWFRFRT